MNKKKLYPIFAIIVVLALAALACGGGASPTQAPQATQPPAATKPPVATKEPTAPPKPTVAPKPTQAVAAGELAVVSTYTYKDGFDYYHIVGEIQNGLDHPVSSVELTVEVSDKAGKTLLKGDDGNPADNVTAQPFLYTLGPGEYSPFDYYFSTDGGEPDQYKVTITGQQTGNVNRVDLTIENAQMVSDGSGNLYLSGELVNQSDKYAQINSVSGAALDKDKKVVAANGYGAVAHTLAPTGDSSGNDRTPFRIRMDEPPDKVATDWAVYFDADQADTFDAFDVQVDILHGYFDDFNSFHLIGLVTNTSDSLINIGLVAGLYDKGGTVLDADTLSAPIYLGQGESTVWDFQYFSNVNSSKDEADKIDSYTVQVDPYWTYKTSYDVVSLETQNETNEKAGNGQWTFKGEVANTSDKELTSMTVVLIIYDKHDNIVGTATSYVSPSGDSFKKGDKGNFETTVYLDPSLDTTGFTFATVVQGYVK